MKHTLLLTLKVGWDVGKKDRKKRNDISGGRTGGTIHVEARSSSMFSANAWNFLTPHWKL
jgi:hypothetical protein